MGFARPACAVGRATLARGGGRVVLGFGPAGDFALESATFVGTPDPDWIECVRQDGKMPNVNGARWTMLENSGSTEHWDDWCRRGGVLDLWFS